MTGLLLAGNPVSGFYRKRFSSWFLYLGGSPVLTGLILYAKREDPALPITLALSWQFILDKDFMYGYNCNDW